MSAATEASDGVCVVCRSPIAPDEPAESCPSCAARYHAECWRYNDGCGVYGCASAARPENLQALEIPAAYWGQETKACPVCGGEILAAAVRCRHCGTTFASNRPVEAEQYRAQAVRALRVRAAEKTGLWILLLGLIPCTSPIAALIGVPWYISRRGEIAAMHGSRAAICTIGVAVACVQTVLLIALSTLYAVIGNGP